MGKNIEIELVWQEYPHLLEGLFREAIERSGLAGPKLSTLQVSLAYTLMLQGKFYASREVLANILSSDPTDAEALFCESKIALYLREADAWNKFEARWAVNCTGERPIPRHQEWDGSPLEGKTVLLAGEGGLGDQIQFARFAPCIKRVGAGRVIVSVDRRLVPMLRFAPGLDCIVETVPGTNLVDPKTEYDVGVPMLTAPSLLGISFDDFPAPVPLWIPDELVESACRRIGERPAQITVGLNWLSTGKARCIPFQVFHELAIIPGVQLFALGERRRIASEIKDMPIINAGVDTGEIDAIQQTAATMMGLDVVISVDSMVAHLAGSLGCPTWLLLHKIPEWTWGLTEESTPWYKSMRLFRREDDWAALIHRVAQELLSLQLRTASALPSPTS